MRQSIHLPTADGQDTGVNGRLRGDGRRNMCFGATEEEHDERLKAVMEVAESSGLVFNSEKCTIKQSSISFFGNIYSAAGVSPDPPKVKYTLEITVSQDKEDLQRSLGLMTYIGYFISNLSKLAAALRDLLEKDGPFYWSEDHKRAFNELKKAITTKACMACYDVKKKPITLEVDASMKRLGDQLHLLQRPSRRHSPTIAT